MSAEVSAKAGSTPACPDKVGGPGYMFKVYILESEKSGRFYIGYSEDADRRLVDHNSRKVKSTRPYRPWMKVYEESCATEADAISRERHIKVDEVPGVYSKAD